MTVSLVLRGIKGSTLSQQDMDGNLSALASMEGNISSVTKLTVSTTLSPSIFGQLVIFNSPTIGATLPLISTTVSGDMIYFMSNANGCTISHQSSDAIIIGGSSVASLSLNSGDGVALVSDGIAWNAMSGNLTLPYSTIMNGSNWTTAPLFDSSKKIATTEFVHQSGFHFHQSNGYVLSTTSTLTLSQLNHWGQIQTNDVTITMPLLSTVSAGSTFTFLTPTGVSATIQGNTSDSIISTTGVGSNTYSMSDNSTLSIVSSSGGWYITEYTNTTDPNFVTPTANTPVLTDNSTRLATTAFVKSQNYLVQSTGDTRYAALNGSTNQTFDVANATTLTQALNRGSGDTRYAALNGSTGQSFNVANATNSNQALNVGQANSLYAPFDNRTIQNVTGSRSIGVTYYNSTGLDIDIAINHVLGPGASVSVLNINGLPWNRGDNNNSSGNLTVGLTGIVPNGGNYSVTILAGSSYGITNWTELRR